MVYAATIMSLILHMVAVSVTGKQDPSGADKRQNFGSIKENMNRTLQSFVNDSILNNNIESALNESSEHDFASNSFNNVSSVVNQTVILLDSGLQHVDQSTGSGHQQGGQSYVIIMLSGLVCLAIVFALFGLFKKADAHHSKEDDGYMEQYGHVGHDQFGDL